MQCRVVQMNAFKEQVEGDQGPKSLLQNDTHKLVDSSKLGWHQQACWVLHSMLLAKQTFFSNCKYIKKFLSCAKNMLRWRQPKPRR